MTWIRKHLPLWICAAVAYLPLFATHPGQVVADTKQYLYVDPGGVLSASQSLWDPDWALGSVTHQSIGYLWPMGPFFWLADAVGLPDWFAQRLWVGSLIFVAALGVLWLWRILGTKQTGSVVAALAYALSPYALSYATRGSVLLLAWSALPWLIGLGIKSTRTQTWRHPALLGLVAMSVGSVNASSLIFAGLGVILWFPFAIWVQREISFRTGMAVAGRIGIAVVGCSLWWAGPLVVQGFYGPPVLRFSETLEVVASGSTSTEAWRGLGFWVFYGGDKTGPWVTAAVRYLTSPVQLAVSFAFILTVLLAVTVVRWRHRAYLLTLMVAGLGLTVGLHPYENPSLVGTALRDLGEGSTAGLTLRSSPRALPLFLLGSALLLGAAVSALYERWNRPGTTVRTVAILLILANISPLFTGDYVGTELARDEHLPEYWIQAATDLDQTDGSRVLVVPGNDFSAHRWGNTLDHILPGLIDRPMAIRELIGFSSEPGSDLLVALDRRFQEGVLDPDSVAPVAALMGVGDIALQLDLEYERFRTPRPQELWDAFSGDIEGLSEAVTYGDPVLNAATDAYPLLDEAELGLLQVPRQTPPVAVFHVEADRGILSTSVDQPVVVSGDGEGIVDMAEAGLLEAGRPVLYSASLDDEQLAAAVASGASFVITDTNRQRARRWKTVRDNVGFTERADGADQVVDPTDVRLDVMGQEVPGATTTAVQDGALVAATSYGNPISYHPENRPVMALDGDPTTAWLVAAFSDAKGHALTIEPDTPVLTSAVTLLQSQDPQANRTISDLTITVNGATTITVLLDDTSLSAPGQVVQLPVQQVHSLQFTIDETSAGRRPGYGDLSAVGIAEVKLGNLIVHESIVTPTDVFDRLANDGDDADLAVVLTRLRTDPTSVVRDDTERIIDRRVTLPAERDFVLSGTARVSARATGNVVDGLMGSAVVHESAHLPGSVRSRGSAIFDADPTTMWQTPFGSQVGHFVDFTLVEPAAGLTAQFAVDELHSAPESLTIINDGTTTSIVVNPDGSATLPALVPGPVRLTIATVTQRFTTDWYSGTDVIMPIGLYSLGDDQDNPPVVTVGTGGLTDGCRSDLVLVNEAPIPVRLTAVNHGQLAIEGCTPIHFSSGVTSVITAVGRELGIDVDQLVFESIVAPQGATATPALEVIESTRGIHTVTVLPSEDAFWIVLAESYNAGWHATISGGADLGQARLVDGFANGWLIDPADFVSGEPLVIELVWAPQGTVRWVFLLGAAFCLAALLLAALDRRTGPAYARDNQALPQLALMPEEGVSVLVAISAALVAAIGAALTTRPFVGLLVGVAVAVSLYYRHRKGLRFVPMGGALLALAGLGAYVVGQTVRYNIDAGGHWPGLFERGHVIGWLGLGLLLGEAVAATVVGRRE